MKIFISQPMDGKNEIQLGEQQLEVAEWLQRYFGDGTEVVNAYVKAEAPASLHDGQIGLWYMAQSIKVMSECDAIVLVGDWLHSRGCQIERKLAEAYGLPIIVKETPNA